MNISKEDFFSSEIEEALEMCDEDIYIGDEEDD